jgi:hypothetical protein
MQHRRLLGGTEAGRVANLRPGRAHILDKHLTARSGRLQGSAPASTSPWRLSRQIAVAISPCRSRGNW